MSPITTRARSKSAAPSFIQRGSVVQAPPVLSCQQQARPLRQRNRRGGRGARHRSYRRSRSSGARVQQQFPATPEYSSSFGPAESSARGREHPGCVHGGLERSGASRNMHRKSRQGTPFRRTLGPVMVAGVVVKGVVRYGKSDRRQRPDRTPMSGSGSDLRWRPTSIAPT
jgi:hypothetical protein